MTTTRQLPVEPATNASVAPFGVLLGPQAEAPEITSVFYGDRLVMKKPAKFVADDTLEITVATLHRRPLEARWMERHFLHTQSFIPLGGKPFLMIVAPPNGDAPMPDFDQARALLFDGSAGFCMHLGTWHEVPLAVVDDTTVLILIRRDTARDLRNVVGNEAQGPDVDKKDIVARTGTILHAVL
jgi:ureidoglycolate lyase